MLTGRKRSLVLREISVVLPRQTMSSHVSLVQNLLVGFYILSFKPLRSIKKLFKLQNWLSFTEQRVRIEHFFEVPSPSSKLWKRKNATFDFCCSVCAEPTIGWNCFKWHQKQVSLCWRVWRYLKLMVVFKKHLFFIAILWTLKILCRYELSSRPYLNPVVEIKTLFRNF